MAVKFPNDQKHTNIFNSKALQNLPKMVFLFENKPSGNPARKITFANFREKKITEKTFDGENAS
jgi:hypothetical protein